MPINAPFSSSMDKEIRKAANIVNAFFDSSIDADSAVPIEFIQNCRGLAFLTVVKAGFIWSGKMGTGLVIARLPDGSWSAPSGIGTAGVGFGAEIGGELIDFMIILGSESAVRTFKKGTQVSVGAGLDLAVGPVGRSAGASVNAGGGGLSGNYTYSHAKGIFAGVGLHGSTILVRGEMNSRFYGREVSPREILSGEVAPPAGSCEALYDAITRVTMARGGLSDMDNRLNRGNGGACYGSPQASMNHNYHQTDSMRHSFHQQDSSMSNAAQRSNSFERKSFSGTGSRSSSGSVDDDPRLKRYANYRSERELYAQFQKGTASTPEPAPVTASTYASAYAAPAAPAPASTYAAGAPTSTYYTGNGVASSATPKVNVRTVPANHYAKPSVPRAAMPTSSAPQTPAPPLPPPATGAETKEVYTNVIQFVSARCPHANLQHFKDNCRLFGQDAMSLDAFYSYLTSICTKNLLMELMPQLVRLLPTQEKRERLWLMYCRETLMLRV